MSPESCVLRVYHQYSETALIHPSDYKNKAHAHSAHRLGNLFLTSLQSTHTPYLAPRNQLNVSQSPCIVVIHSEFSTNLRTGPRSVKEEDRQRPDCPPTRC